MVAWIAATALTHGAAVCTQDADFDAVTAAHLVEVVRVYARRQRFFSGA